MAKTWKWTERNLEETGIDPLVASEDPETTETANGNETRTVTIERDLVPVAEGMVIAIETEIRGEAAATGDEKGNAAPTTKRPRTMLWTSRWLKLERRFLRRWMKR